MSLSLFNCRIATSRFERQAADDLARLLVDPSDTMSSTFRTAARAINARGQGAFLPLWAPPGTGKTTLAENLGHFERSLFAITVSHDGEVTYDALVQAVRKAGLPPNEKRVVPVNIDHRESDPPSDAEMAAIKRFLRSDAGARIAVCWPETSEEIARAIAEGWERIAGSPHVPVPVAVDGPDRSKWVETAINTLKFANAGLGDLEALGVDPHSYEPSGYPSLGEYLRAISTDFCGPRRRVA